MSNLLKYGMKQCDCCRQTLVPDNVKICKNCLHYYETRMVKVVSSKINKPKYKLTIKL